MTLSSNKEQWKQRWLASCSITCVDLELVRTQSINYPDGTLYGLLRRWILIWYLIWRYDGTLARWRYEISAIKINWSSRQTPRWCLGVNDNYFWGHITYEFDKFYIGSFINYTGWQKMSHLLPQSRILLTQCFCDQIFVNRLDGQQNILLI